MAIATPVQGFKQSPQLRERTQQILQQTAQQRPNLPPELQTDQARFSDELVGEVGKALETSGDPNNLEAMLGALTENFLDRKAQEAQPAGKDKDKKTREAEWKPMVENGQVISPVGQIGEVTIKEKPGENNDQKQKVNGPKKANSAGTPAVAGKPGAAATPPVNHAQKGQKANPDDNNNGKDDDKVEFTPESKQMLEKMQGQGMNTPDPKQEKSDGPGERKQDVFMPAAGFTQAVKVREAGPIKNGDVILTYRKLDDLPSGNIAILKDKKGKDGLEEYHKKIERGEKVDQLSAEQQRQLLNPTATH